MSLFKVIHTLYEYAKSCSSSAGDKRAGVLEPRPFLWGADSLVLSQRLANINVLVELSSL